jgi:hypothetical protein
MKLIIIVCMTLILSDIEGSTVCYCYCCRPGPCVPNLVGILSTNGICNSTTCNQNVCFEFNGTLCPAIGSPGNVYAICSAYSIYNHLNFVPIIIITFYFFC